MLRIDEKGVPKSTRPLPFDQALRDQLVSSVVDSNWNRLETHANDFVISMSCFKILGRLAPIKTLAYLDEHEIANQLKNVVLSAIIQGLAATDVERAIEVADAEEQPDDRVRLLFQLLRSTSPDHPAVPAIEQQIKDSLMSVNQPALRLAMAASLAEHYWLTGRSKLAFEFVD
jgi:hypothetical protein